MAERIHGFCAVLAGNCLSGVEVLGLTMLTSERVKPVKPRTPAAKKPPVEKNNKVDIPDEWKLTPEQKGFIDLFNQDENNKQ